MAITDQTILSEIQAHMLEPQNSGASWFSGQWTPDEVVGYLNYRQYRFMKETMILLHIAQGPCTPNVTRQTLPTDWVVTQRVAYVTAGGVYHEVPPGDSWEADQTILDWPYDQFAYPQLYTDGETPTLTIEVFPAPSGSGELELLYVQQPVALTGAGVNFTVNDEFVPAIKWGAMADMLWKVGRAQDPERAGYCESRFEEGVQAASIIIGGWM